MNNDILYISDDKLNLKTGNNEKITLEAEHLTRYKESLLQIKQRQDWKNSGYSAHFQGTYQTPIPASDAHMRLCSICPYDENGFIYSAETDSTSGVFYKFAAKGNENHIYHSNKEVFYSLDYNASGKKVALSVAKVQGDSNTLPFAANGKKDIAVFEIEENNLKTITSGDSSDENPSFSNYDDKILYNSRGIGRDASMNMVRFSESSIFSIDQRGNVAEVLSEKDYDLVAPKDDKNGNIYYIKKPYRKPRQKGTGNLVLDLLLLPFWLLYGIVYFMMFLGKVAKAKSNKGSKLSSSGNPYVTNAKSERELFIHQEMLDIYGEEKRNLKSGDKTAGFAPKSFELWMMDKKGNKLKLRDKVLDFDVNPFGQIVYTNGKYVFTFYACNNDFSKNDLDASSPLICPNSSNHSALPQDKNTASFDINKSVYDNNSNDYIDKNNNKADVKFDNNSADSGLSPKVSAFNIRTKVQENTPSLIKKSDDTVLFNDSLITAVRFNTPNQNPCHKPYSPF